MFYSIFGHYKWPLCIQERLLIVLCTSNSSYKLVVVGGGAGGCSTAAKFASKYPGQVAVIEPRDVRFFKPILIRYINYGNTGCGVVFLRGEGEYKIRKIFAQKNQHNRRKLSNFENWVKGEMSKGAKI